MCVTSNYHQTRLKISQKNSNTIKNYIAGGLIQFSKI